MSTSPIGPNSNTAAGNTSNTAASAAAGNIGNQNVFLQLLVAQLKYQDPSQPTDGTQFVSELAQFSDLSNTTKMSSDLDSIKQMMQAAAAPATPAGSTTNQTAKS